MSPELEQLLITNRVRQTNPGAIVPIYETVHPVSGVRLRRHGRQRVEAHLRHTSPRTKPSLGYRRSSRRAQSKAARIARRANRGA